MNKNPSQFQGVNRPVETVSWFDAVKFCNTLNPNPICDEHYNFINPQGQNTSLLTDVEGFRLPTEAEWEFAARGGKEFSENRLKYAGSNDMDVVGWYDENNGYETKPVGLKLSNELGIFDMSGNVWEWCWDWYDDDFYNKQGTNPVNFKKGSSRVLRGGSWSSYSHRSGIADRLRNDPSSYWRSRGFRVVFCFFSSQLSQEKGNK